MTEATESALKSGGLHSDEDSEMEETSKLRG